jgi:hypothetical protein
MYANGNLHAQYSATEVDACTASLGTHRRRRHLWEVSVVEAVHNHAMLAQPAPQQRAPGLVPNCPRAPCAHPHAVVSRAKIFVTDAACVASPKTTAFLPIKFWQSIDRENHAALDFVLYVAGCLLCSEISLDEWFASRKTESLHARARR